MKSSVMNIRIGVVQFSPKIGQIQANLARAHELCKEIKPRTLDLLCFPEMALTGYVFENASAISPYLEQPRTGVTSRFCSEIARKLQCYVFAGYPEILSSADKRNPKVVKKNQSLQEVGANSAVIYGPDGEWVGGYRKTHLFETDKTWAKAGTGFATFTLPQPLRTVCLGICMDLNPQIAAWTRVDGPYEMATHCTSNQANLLILLNAWLDSKEEPEEAYDWRTLNYWAARLRPLWSGGGGNGDDEPPSTMRDNSKLSSKETIVVVCNRSGDENGKTFAGSSAIFSMQSGSGHPKLLDMMERREEGMRIWDIQV